MYKNSNKIYLAYGSNLNLEQMGYRCPYAVPLGPSELSGYRLMFRGGNRNAVATVEPEEGYSVPVLLWEITPRDEEALDRYEGWPRLYRKETVTVSHNSKPVEAMVYIMNEIYPLGLPGEYYLNVIAEGYASAGFDTAVLDEAVKASKPHKRPGARKGSKRADSGTESAEVITIRDAGNDADSAATGAEKCGDCLACSHSASEPAETVGEFDRLFCVVKQEYVGEDGYCDEFN